MRELILLKSGEIALKGLNRASFEDKMISNAKRRLYKAGNFRIYKAQSTMYVEPKDENADLDEAFRILKKVFGIAALSRAAVVEKDYEDIRQKAILYLSDVLGNAKTFKVVSRRADKSFPMKSPELCATLGGDLLDAFPHLTVDVQNPEVVVMVEIRDFAAYIHAGQEPGAGGMPVGTSGRAALLISGGIDSPVAGYMMTKRGLALSAVHFVSPPYTSERAKLKVIDLTRKVSEYSGAVRLFVVHFTHAQEEIKNKCPEEFFTIIMRRMMMRISQKIAALDDCGALITGESLAQVASQTLMAIACTDIVCEIPVFRPLIGMDKSEIVDIAHKIDTFETSILPFEDCCTVFTPRHPKTKPKMADVANAESALDIDSLINECMDNLEVLDIQPE